MFVNLEKAHKIHSISLLEYYNFSLFSEFYTFRNSKILSLTVELRSAPVYDLRRVFTLVSLLFFKIKLFNVLTFPKYFV